MIKPARITGEGRGRNLGTGKACNLEACKDHRRRKGEEPGEPARPATWKPARITGEGKGGA